MKTIYWPELTQEQRRNLDAQAFELLKRRGVGQADVIGDFAAAEGLGISEASVLESVLGERSLARTVFEDPEVIRGIVRHTAGCHLRALLLATRNEVGTPEFQREASMCDQVWVGDVASATLVQNRIGPVGAMVARSARSAGTKVRTHLTLNSNLLDKAAVLLAADHYNSVSEYLEQLIRAEWERRTKPQDRYAARLCQKLAESQASKSPSPAVQPQTQEVGA